jgi:peptide/nickel transport system substrate-binding protein
MNLPKHLLLISLILTGLILAGCGAQTPQPTPTGANTATPQATQTTEIVLPQPTETPIRPHTLVVCTQDEPQTLYIYGGSSRSMWTVLEAVYDGPIDSRGFSHQPVILEKIPALSDGDAVLNPVSMQKGDVVVDVSGSPVALAAGTRVLPSGCTRPECAQTWDGTAPLMMDRLEVTFRLLPGLTWSDGSPLLASDSVFSYQLAADPATPASRYVIDRTYSYKAVDERTTVWTGLPGYYEQRFGSFFWLPQPEHALGSKSAAAVLSDSSVNRSPLGWGPYVIQEWTAGDHITLRKNENYFRAAEGLPVFDTLVFRFIGAAADGNMNALLAGECDVVDQNGQFLEMIPGLLERETQNKLRLHIGQGPEWENLNFGIRPAAYDDGYDPASGDRPDLFSDVRVRQAFAYCIDRQQIINEHIYRRSDLPGGYLPPSHPLFEADLPIYRYDPAEGRRLLAEAGWQDDDANPDTPLVAVSVANVPPGTPLTVNYLTTQAPLRQSVAQAAAASLRACGIDARVQLMNPGELFGPGPEGLVFGRRFDLAQFSWEAGSRPNCQLYASAQIPGPNNHWIGANVSGYSSEAFDAACAAAYWARPGDGEFIDLQKQIQQAFATELPAVPLYFYPKIAITRADLCGLQMDVTARSIFWNLEELNYGEGCP